MADQNDTKTDTKTDTKQSDPKPSDADRARADAQAASQKAIEAQAKADDAKKSDEQRAADKAKADADRAHAVATEKEAALVPTEPMTAADARVLSPHVTDDMGAEHHFAQKFGNDPANPAPAQGEHTDPDLMTVKLSRLTPDVPDGPVFTMVHPDMVGDYLRAGWSKA